MAGFIVRKRTVISLCAIILLWHFSAQAAPLKPVKFKDIVAKAQLLSEKPFIEAEGNLPDAILELSYDEWRDIRFKPEKSLWASDPFSIQFFHLGGLFKEPVLINISDKKNITPVPFSADFFDYTQSAHQGILPQNLGFAGFRIHYPINSPEYADEIISFLGASYFRALGKDLVYGMSARGLAVNIAELSGEEYPYFREFWIVKPEPKAKDISFYALMESTSLTGAYLFTVDPGQETLVSVRSVLFFRKKVRKLGLAPLTSMFFYGENTRSMAGMDFRPEVHDSDGLLIQDSLGGWTWHPLINPENLLINSFGGGQPIGFGLIQRDMDFDHYQDLEARYDKRPSAWVSPKSDWGPGHIELLQIPAQNEYNDNINAYWVINKTFEPGESFEYAYTMQWHAGIRQKSELASAESTRVVSKSDSVMFIIEFLPAPAEKFFSAKDISADIQALNGYTIINSQVIENPVTPGWRLIINVRLDQENTLNKLISANKPSLELRAFLKKDNVPLTETWSYTYLP